MSNRQHFFKRKADAVVGILLLIAILAYASPARAAEVQNLSGLSYTFSISAQATYRLRNGGTAVDPEYERNVRVFWAWVSPANRTLSVLNTMDLQNFEGVWQVPVQTSSVIDQFGPWDASGGMRNILIGNGIMGGGACNATSMLRYVLAENGIPSQATGQPAQSHAYIAGVPSTYYTWVCNCTYREDLLVSNPYVDSVYVHWRVLGDTLTLWVDNNSATSGGVLPPPATQNTVAPTAQPGTNELPVYDVNLDFLMSEDTVFAPIVQEDVPVSPEPIPTTTTGVQQSQNETLPVGIAVGDTTYVLKTRELALLIIAILATLLASHLIRQFKK